VTQIEVCSVVVDFLANLSRVGCTPPVIRNVCVLRVLEEFEVVFCVFVDVVACND
jgi:hypothetical protein